MATASRSTALALSLTSAASFASQRHWLHRPRAPCYVKCGGWPQKGCIAAGSAGDLLNSHANHTPAVSGARAGGTIIEEHEKPRNCFQRPARWWRNLWQTRLPGCEVCLAKRYLGTEVQRSKRSLALMTDEEVTMLAGIINDIVDMDHFDEEQEQEIFEFATCMTLEHIVRALPNEFILVVNEDNPRGIPDHLADVLEQRLVTMVRRELFLPFLDEQDSKRIIHCIVVLVVNGMRNGGHSLHEMKPHELRALRCSVFMKGVLDTFYDSDERAKLVESVTSMIKNVPFVPLPVFEAISLRLITFVGKEIERALHEVAEEFESAARDRRSLELLPEGLNRKLTKDEEAVQRHAPFYMQLRRRTCELLEDRLEEQGNLLKGLHSILPQRFFLESLLSVIDTIFSSMSIEAKLENAMEGAVSPYGGPPPWKL